MLNSWTCFSKISDDLLAKIVGKVGKNCIIFSESVQTGKYYIAGYK